MTVEIYCDGGSKGNGSLNAGYGSFSIIIDNTFYYISTKSFVGYQLFFMFPDSTNNESELKIAIEVLKYLRDNFDRYSKYENITVNMDSKLVVNAYNNGVRHPSQHLIPLYDELNLLGMRLRDLNIKFNWISSIEIKKILGH